MPWAMTACFAILMVTGHSLLYLSPFGQNLEKYQTEAWFRVRGSVAPSPKVIMITVDEATYQQLAFSYMKPISRSGIARILNALADSRAELSILDFFFRDEGEDPSMNTALALALGRLPTFIGSFSFNDPDKPADSSRVEVAPRAEFSRQAERVVSMDIIEDPKVRAFSLHENPGGYATLASAYASREPRKELPGPNDLINFYGPPGAIPRISGATLVTNSPAENERLFRDKVVIVGHALPVGATFSAKDTFRVPTSSEACFGVEVHATVISNIYDHNWIHRFALPVELPILNMWLAALCVIVMRVPSLVTVLVITGSMVGWMVLAYAGFVNHVFIPGMCVVTIMLPLALLVGISVKLRYLRAQYVKIQEMLGISAPES